MRKLIIKLANNRVLFSILFSSYSLALNLLFLLLNLMPSFIRSGVFSIILQKKGRNTFIDYGCYFRYPKKIIIGKNVTINRNSNFYGSFHVKDAHIIIEDNVVISPEVSIYSAGHDHHHLDLPDTAVTVTIKKHVWIGARVIILPGVTIGEGAIIGAGSVVSKDIPSYVIAVGNPATVIKTRALSDA